MTPEEVAELLVGTVFGPVRFVASTGSTNADLLVAARAGAAEGAVLVADHQTAGRGRRGRSWLAPPGSALLASVLLRPNFDADAGGGGVALLSPATALAIRDACASFGAGVRLKWPNDVVAPAAGRSAAGGRRDSGSTAPAIDKTENPTAERPAADRPTEAPVQESKLAGVLAELDSAGPTSAVVIGFGVNLLAHEDLVAAVAAVESTGADDTAPSASNLPLPPVALEQLTDRPPRRNELLAAILVRLDARYRRLGDPKGAVDLLADLRHHSATLGRSVRVTTPRGTITGRATDLTSDGHLVVATSDGPVTVTAGDCHHLRATPR